ncbi:MAG: hypothetical protein AAFQ12_06780 [Pseudomonadota bacterium]
MKRPTFDDIRAERDRFIGPPEPYPVPKLIPASDKAKLRELLDRLLAENIAQGTAAHLNRASER